MKLPAIDWPQTTLVLGLAAIGVVALIYAPAEYHAPIGGLLTLVVGALRSIFRPSAGPDVTTLVLAIAVAPMLTGCGASALRTHQTIATIARVAVVAAHPAIESSCEALMSRCTDAACVERVTDDCQAAGVARDTAHAAVRAYVDTIEIAAHADEGRVAQALDVALSTVARAYAAARETIERLTGYRLPELPPEALAILRALTAAVVGDAS